MERIEQQGESQAESEIESNRKSKTTYIVTTLFWDFFYFSQVTKLCDLGPNDGVCSVQWTREGSYIAVGTALGKVQVTLSKLTSLFSVEDSLD